MTLQSTITYPASPRSTCIRTHCYNHQRYTLKSKNSFKNLSQYRPLNEYNSTCKTNKDILQLPYADANFLVLDASDTFSIELNKMQPLD